MNFVNALSTPRDSIGHHDYLMPLCKETNIMKGGYNMSSFYDERLSQEQKKMLREAAEKFDKQLAEMERAAYETLVGIIGFIIALIYLPVRPWIWMLKKTKKNLEKLHMGTIAPL